MPVSEAQKEASKRYHREHIASLACRVKKEEAELFKEYCEKNGTSVNAALRAYVLSIVMEG